MRNPTPEVPCKHGAPLGRHTGPDFLNVEAGKIYLRRIRLDSGGYDPGGAYWGIGQPLYYAEDQDGNSQFFRAGSRAKAKAYVTNKFPGARFFN